MVYGSMVWRPGGGFLAGTGDTMVDEDRLIHQALWEL